MAFVAAPEQNFWGRPVRLARGSRLPHMAQPFGGLMGYKYGDWNRDFQEENCNSFGTSPCAFQDGP